jgi:hypothetical protein
MSKKKKKKKKKKGPEIERGAFPNKTAARRLAYNLLILNAPGEKQGSNRGQGLRESRGRHDHHQGRERKRR